MTDISLGIRGALIFDGTGAEPYRSDVVIADGRIAAVGGEAPAAEVLDAQGLALAPGFIDVHTHDDAALLTASAMDAKTSQGVTTVVSGNCGISLAPSPMAGRTAPPPPLDLLGPAEAYRYTSFGSYLDALEQSRPVVNVFPLVGHMVLRARAMDALDRPATDAEIETMLAELGQAMSEGAQGISTGLAYPPSKHATSSEVLALASAAAARGGLWTTHMRDERSGVVSAVAETIGVARQSGVRTLISHHKCCGAAAFGLSRTTLRMIEEARRELSLDLDVYPYTASSTVLIEGFARDSRKVTISWSDPYPDMAGRDLAEVAAEWGVDQDEAIARLRPGGAIYHQMDDGDLDRILSYPPSVIGSDGLPQDRRPHPRLWGAFPRVLGRYARDRKLMPMTQAIAKMTGQTAKVLGLEDRGKIAAGNRADLVLFDPETIIDLASYAEPVRPAAGIRMVFVNGEAVWQDGQPSGARPGMVLRRAG